MAATPSFPMPFDTTPCKVWCAQDGGVDAYGNRVVAFNENPDWEGECVYSPAWSGKPDTYDDRDQQRPNGDRVTLTVFLPKSFALDIRGGRIAVCPTDDPVLSAQVFDVVGQPFSFPRSNTPGDYSWAVEAGERLG